MEEVGGLALQAAPSPACEGRFGLQTARRCCLLNALRPPSVPDGDSIPLLQSKTKKPIHSDELFCFVGGVGEIELVLSRPYANASNGVISIGRFVSNTPKNTPTLS